MPYIIICKKADGSVAIAAHPGEPAPEMLQDAQNAGSVEEAAQMAVQVLGDDGAGGPSDGSQSQPGQSDGGDPTGGADDGGNDISMPAGDENMPMDTRDQQMEAGYKRAKKGY